MLFLYQKTYFSALRHIIQCSILLLFCELWKPFYQFVYVQNFCVINNKLVFMLFFVWLRSRSSLQIYIFSLNTLTWLHGILILLCIWSFFRLTEIIFVTIKQKGIPLISAFDNTYTSYQFFLKKYTKHKGFVKTTEWLITKNLFKYPTLLKVLQCL